MRLRFSIFIFMAAILMSNSALAQSWYIDWTNTTWPSAPLGDTGQNGDVTAGDGVYSLDYTVATANASDSYYQFKITNQATQTYPSSDVRLKIKTNGTRVNFTFDTARYNDGGFPAANIVNASHVVAPAIGAETWVVVGSFQNWNPPAGVPLTYDIARDVYSAAVVIPSAGTHQMKFTANYTWTMHQFGRDGWGVGAPDSSNSIYFSTAAANNTVSFVLDPKVGRARIEAVQTARFQLIHASPEPSLAKIDVYMDGQLKANDLAFRAAMTYLEIAAGAHQVQIAPGTSASAAEAVYTTNLNLTPGEAYVLATRGLLNPTGYAPNPSGTAIHFALSVKAGAKSVSVPGKCELMLHHSVSDAPTYDIYNAAGPNLLTAALTYSGFGNYVALNPQAYSLYTTVAGASTPLARYDADFTVDGGKAGVLFLSGFNSPDQNKWGAWEHAFIAWSDGSVEQLTRQTTTQAAGSLTNPATCLSAALGLDVSVRGVVTAATQFGANGPAFLQNNGYGLAFFGGINGLGLTIGDDVRLSGRLSHLNGQEQIEPIYSVNIISSGNPPPAPHKVTLADIYSPVARPENYESALLRLTGVSLADPAQWPTPGANKNVEIIDATGVKGVLRIDRDTNVDEMPVPVGLFTLTALLTQFDDVTGDGFCGGYQLLPRSADDFRAGGADFLIWAPPTPDKPDGDSSAVYLKSAIEANGYIVNLTTDLIANPLETYKGLFIALGVFESTAQISEAGIEAQLILEYLNNGSSVYMEGGDVWYYDPQNGGFNFNGAFGITPLSDGGARPDVSDVVGVRGTFTAGFSSVYRGENQWLDRLAPTDTTESFAIFTNAFDQQTIGIARYHESKKYRTIGVSFQFSGIAADRQTALMAAYLEFMQRGENPPDYCPPENVSTLLLDGGHTVAISWTAPDVCFADHARLSYFKSNEVSSYFPTLTNSQLAVYVTPDAALGAFELTDVSEIFINLTGNNHPAWSNGAHTVSIHRANGDQPGQMLAEIVDRDLPNNALNTPLISYQYFGDRRLQFTAGEPFWVVLKGTTEGQIQGPFPLADRNANSAESHTYILNAATGGRFVKLAASSGYPNIALEVNLKLASGQRSAVSGQQPTINSALPAPELSVIGYTLPAAWSSRIHFASSQRANRQVIESFTIYRSVNTGLFSELATTRDGGIFDYEDAGVAEGDLLCYAVMANYTDGGVSILSEESCIDVEPLCAPSGLNAEFRGDQVSLKWAAPLVCETQLLTDGFEDYADFSINFAPWTLVDGDGLETFQNPDANFPHETNAMAFIIFNPAATTPPLSQAGYGAHSGTKFAACLSAVPGNSQYNNDWLITPPVQLGTGSRVSFWARSLTNFWGLERFRVGVSYTGTNPQDFTIISPGRYHEAPIGWTLYNYDLRGFDGLPIYIGINCISEDAFILGIDDVEITSNGGRILAENRTRIPLKNTEKAGSNTKGIKSLSALNPSFPVKSVSHSTQMRLKNTEDNGLKVKGIKSSLSVSNPSFPVESVSYSGRSSFTGYLLTKRWTDAAGAHHTVTVPLNPELLDYNDTNVDSRLKYCYTLMAVYVEGYSAPTNEDCADKVGIEDPDPTGRPTAYRLDQNRPNPFQVTTAIDFALPTAGFVRLEIYNSAGQLVKTLLKEPLPAAYHSIRWDGANDAGQPVATGVYFYRLQADSFSQTRRIVLLR